jgi:hypothetical protein
MRRAKPLEHPHAEHDESFAPFQKHHEEGAPVEAFIAMMQ